jgi:hypothetical protein
MAALPKISHHSGGALHLVNNPTASNGGQGFGPLVTYPAGTWKVLLDCDSGTIKFQTAAGVVLASGPGMHRITLAAPTTCQFVGSGTGGTRFCGGSIFEDLDAANERGQGTST